MLMLSRLLKRAISETVEEVVSTTIDQVLAEKLPAIIRKHLKERFAEDPTLSLTKAGFYWAFVIALQGHWPDVPNETAARWLDDYLDAPVGAPGYEWTPRAAGELASAYVQEFGEAA
jgi:hypothetical protein